MRPRRIKSRSGISEIIGSLLMVVVIVALSATIFAYATTNVGNFGNNFSNLFSNSGNALSQKIVIEQI
ncbi:MAG: archaellin/type IV pilin N-terminal domain-containing protein, partial [Nitrososphaerales archaeon]